MEGGEPPYSARAVAAMSLETDAGRASVEQVCRVFGLSRSAYYAAQRPSGAPDGGDAAVVETAREGEIPAKVVPLRRGRRPGVSAEALRAAIQEVVKAHLAWGVRKVWATLRRSPRGMRVGHRRVWAHMKAMGLCLTANRARPEEPESRTVMVQEPNRRWGTDMTTVYTAEDGWVAVSVLIDSGCRTVLALGVTKSQESWALLSPVRAALLGQFGTVENVPDGLELRTDHGPQYTGQDCADLCREWGLDHTLAAVGRPTGNAGTERVIRTLKEECIWLRDWKNRQEVEAALEAWRKSYNHDRPHQSLAWQTPVERRAERLGVSTDQVARELAAA